jgi:hypothetical protein
MLSRQDSKYGEWRNIVTRIVPNPQAVAGFLALAALAAGIISQVEAQEVLGRAAMAYGAGLVIGHIWHALISGPTLTVQSTVTETPEEDLDLKSAA